MRRYARGAGTGHARVLRLPREASAGGNTTLTPGHLHTRVPTSRASPRTRGAETRPGAHRGDACGEPALGTWAALAAAADPDPWGGRRRRRGW